MRVVHIHTYARGVGDACLRLHRALLSKGVDSVVVTRGAGGDFGVFEIKESDLNKYIPPRNVLIRKIKNRLRRRGIGLLKTERWDRATWALEEKYPDACFTSCYSSYDLANDPHVLSADIIHLHWVQNFLDFTSFFRRMRQLNKPLVWTIHDLNPLMGGFHHERKKAMYYSEYKELEDAMYSIKRDALVSYKNLALVALSSEMESLIKAHEFFIQKPVYKILDAIDEKDFTLIDKTIARMAIGLPTDRRIALFVSSTLNDSNKGFSECVKALDKDAFKNVLLLAVGDGTLPKTEHIKIRQFNHVNGTVWMSILYSAADIFINCSYQESFGQTTVEAMLCGTPVVMTPVGIAKDLINEENGIVCHDFSPDAIAIAIDLAFSRSYNSARIRDLAISEVSPLKIAQDYINVYAKQIDECQAREGYQI